MELLSRDAIDYSIEGHSLADLPNYHEQVVLKIMRELYTGDNPPCTCTLCVEDIYALALNSLPARYIQATSVRSYQTSATYVSEDQVRESVLAAVERVRTQPNH